LFKDFDSAIYNKEAGEMKLAVFLACISLILVFASSTFAWIDNFDDGNDDSWTVIQGDWEVKDGGYRQDDTDWTTTTTNETFHRSFVGDVNWSDYTAEVDVIIDDPGDLAPIAGIFVRVAEKTVEGQYYFFRIDTRDEWGPSANEAPNHNFAGTLDPVVEGGKVAPAMEENGVEYHLKVIAEGNHFLFYVDDELFLDVTDDVDPILNGAVGLGTFNCGASFDNLEVTGAGVPGSVSKEDKLATCWGMLKAGKKW
jgi:hypothetical protein